MGIRCADHVTPLYPQKLALISPTGGGRSVGIVRSRTKATELCAHPQEKITVCMRRWYLLLCWGGFWSAGRPADQTPPIQSDKYQCRIDTVILS